MIGLKEQTVRGAKTLAEARARHRWQIAPDYNVARDCLDRHDELRDQVALYYEDDTGHTEQYTFGQMVTAANRFANALKGLGIKRGDVLAVHLPQRPETAIAHMAAYRIGAIALPISKLFGADALKYRLSDSAAPAIVLEAESLAKLADIRVEIPTLRHLIVVGEKAALGVAFDTLLAMASPELEVAPGSAEDPILLMYTSGTTGNPKGVLHASRCVLGHNGIDYSYNFLREGDLYYSPADWAWAGGLLDGLLGIWPYGVPVLAYRSDARFDPDVTFKLLEKYGATVGLYPPTALKVLREIKRPRERYRLKLRCIVSGAEPVSPELARWVDEELKVEFNQGFGQTEANYFIGTCSALERPRLEPLGKAYPGHEVAIVGPDGAPLRPGEVGDIAIRREDPVVMKEYWKNPAAMGEKLAGDWLLTGDLGRVDGEGYIYFQGRADDLIKSSGYRIGPAEVEASIMEHKAVASCAVIGVPDAQRGQAIKAFVKLGADFRPSRQIAGEIQAHVKNKLGAHEYPREIEFVDDFPMTVTGKIKRRDLREMEEKRRAARA